MVSWNVLVVDDDRDLTVHFSKPEPADSYRFRFAHSIAEARAVLTAPGAPKFDLILLDAYFGEESEPSGVAFLKELRDGVRSEIPVIILTAHRDAFKLENVFDYGISGYLFKPIADRDLRSKLAAFFARQDDLYRKVNLDALTGLHNRRSFREVAAIECARARRERRPLCVAFLDLDNFKEINDTRGHLCGDQVLKTAATLITTAVRSGDWVFRYAGDEFVVILPGLGLDEAWQILERLRETIAEHPFEYSGETVRLTISAGIDLCDNDDHEVVLKRVDALMYRAKRQGKNTVARG